MEEASSEVSSAQRIRDGKCHQAHRQLGLQTGAQEHCLRAMEGRFPGRAVGPDPSRAPSGAPLVPGKAHVATMDRCHGAHVTTHLPPALSGGAAGKAREGQVPLSSEVLL